MIYTYYITYMETKESEIDLLNTGKETSLLLLQSQLQPHFIFNSLNSIHSLIFVSPQKAQDMLLSLSDFLRISLDHKDKGLVSLEEELHFIDTYLKIEQIRFEDRLKIVWDIDKALFKSRIPNMLLQPLFENAIKHGLNKITSSFSISVKIEKNNEAIKITISNPCLSNTKITDGNGLSNLKKRLSIQYGRKDLLQISTVSNQFTIQIIVPQYERK